MSKFENKIYNSIISGLNLSQDMYKQQYYIGRFISGWKQSVFNTNKRIGQRRVDIHIYGNNTIFRVSRAINIEIDGGQHDDPLSELNNPQYDSKTGKLIWTRSQIFNDQIDRDDWINLKSLENNQIMIRIKEPIWRTKNSAYTTQLEKLVQKVSSPGYLSAIIQECEKKHAKGCIIYWDREKLVTKNRNWPKLKYYNGI